MSVKTKDELRQSASELLFSYVGGADDEKVKELLTNIIDSYPESSGGAANYSTEEVQLGTKWIDAKDIFRKVFTVDAGVAANIAFNLSEIGIDTMISMESLLIDANVVYAGPNSNSDASALSYSVSWDKGGSSKLLSILYDAGSIGNELGGGFIIIEYTKN